MNAFSTATTVVVAAYTHCLEIPDLNAETVCIYVCMYVCMHLCMHRCMCKIDAWIHERTVLPKPKTKPVKFTSMKTVASTTRNTDLRIHDGPFPDHLLPAAYFDPHIHRWGVLRVPMPPKSPAVTFRVNRLSPADADADANIFVSACPASTVNIYDPVRGKWTDAWTMPATSAAAASAAVEATTDSVATLYLRFFSTNAELVAEDTDTGPMAVQLWTQVHGEERLVQRVQSSNRTLTEELYRHASQQWLYHARQHTSVSPTRPGLTRENESQSPTERFNKTGLQYFWSRLSDYHEDVVLGSIPLGSINDNPPKGTEAGCVSSGEGDPAILAILQASLENVYTASWHMNQHPDT